MANISASGIQDVNVAREVEGLKQAIHSGDTSQLTLIRLVSLVENLLDRVWTLEQKEAASVRDQEERSHI